MLMRSLIILPLVLAGLPAAAQVLGEAIPGQNRNVTKGTPWQPTAPGKSRPCPEYGPGFVRLEGSTGCVRIGGSVSAEYGVGSGGRTGSAVNGGVRLETRDQTTLGPVRAVIQAQGRLDRGNLNGYTYGYR